MGTALARRVAALDTKLGSLDREVAAWKKVPATNKGFEIHTSQIDEVCGTLTAMQTQIKADVAKALNLGPLSYPAVERFERQILAAFHIWECYRSKWALRLVQSSQEVLVLLDDLAWHAYRLPRDRAVASKAITAAAVREPPLVFPNVRWSPFARSREAAYEVDESTGDLTALESFDKWLAKIPVPLIGIPWYQLAHLPDAVFIGHEVGHLVEQDLALEEALRCAIDTALAEAPKERREAWSGRWRSEAFADIYGVLTAGSAYAAVLLDLLALDEPDVTKRVQPDPNRPPSQQWSDYPTPVLRARLVCEAVRQLPDKKAPYVGLFAKCASDLKGRWPASAAAHAMSEYDEDVPEVVKAVLSTPLPTFAQDGAPRCLTDVIAFTAVMENRAREDAKRANGLKDVTGADVRTLVAGVAHAFVDDAARFHAAGAQQRFQRQMSLKRTQGVRGVSVPGFVPGSPADRHREAASSVLGFVK
jgi:hypothetical protein